MMAIMETIQIIINNTDTPETVRVRISLFSMAVCEFFSTMFCPLSNTKQRFAFHRYVERNVCLLFFMSKPK